MNVWPSFFSIKRIALLCAVCFLSTAYADDETDLESLQQLVAQWKEGIATGDADMLLPLYVRADQQKVAKALSYVKTGQTTLPLPAEMPDVRWFKRADEIQWSDLALAASTAPVTPPAAEPTKTAAVSAAEPEPAPALLQVIDKQPGTSLPVTPPVVPVQLHTNVVLIKSVPVSVEQQTYTVGLPDQNFRKVLTRWARAAGWMFEPEHWSVARDIPVGGTDSVMTDFKTAVRRLLKSTLLTDLPVQPCFYSNKVLRVIPASELCSRSEH